MIRTPVFEDKELFVRSSGVGSEVVQKEMYEFEDKSGRLLALRPEGTAGAVRAVLQDGAFLRYSIPLGVFYDYTCYRYERPQNGRFREFTQFGVELFGTSHRFSGAFVILLAESIFKELNLSGKVSLRINSIGCKKCREKYLVALREFFCSSDYDFCEDCFARLDNNPLRILDCKNEICIKAVKKAPSIIEFLCEECRSELEELKVVLESVGVRYIIDPSIVRGLDYYTGFVFEYKYKGSSGRNLTVCGGGRYDNLVEQLGGPSTPALGFGIGLDRLLIAMDDADVLVEKKPVLDFFVACVSDKEANFCFCLAKKLWDEGIRAQTDIVGRTLGSQLRYATKIGARFLMVIGNEEIKNGKAKIKDIKDKVFFEVSLGDNFGKQVVDIFKKSNK